MQVVPNATVGAEIRGIDLARKPNRWIAAGLALVFPIAGMLYVARPGWAGGYFAIQLAIFLVDIFILRAAGAVTEAALLGVAVAAAIHAHRLASSYDSQVRPWYSRWRGLAGIVATLSAIAFGTRAFLIEPFRFPGSSMAPSIEPRGYLLVSKWGYGHYEAYGISLLKTKPSSSIQRGDILVFQYPEDPSVNYAKRVVGLPKDRVSYYNKKLSVNNQEAALREVGLYIHGNLRLGRYVRYSERLGDLEYSVLLEPEAPSFVMPARAFPFRDRCVHSKEGVSCEVPEGHYFVLGDNRDNSSDSRIWGFVPESKLVGKVLYIIQ